MPGDGNGTSHDDDRPRVLILGAAGRDFHLFNTRFRDDDSVRVVGFTATQIPDIDGRRYPAELAGPNYPEGLPIWEEDEMEALIHEHHIDAVLFGYSDLDHRDVMHLASRANAVGADFVLPDVESQMLVSTKPVVAVTATRTGAGKSQTTRALTTALKAAGKRVAVIRHPMPYGDLVKQRCQRFATHEDLDLHECTIEEREEYEPHIDAGHVVFAGVDYADILAAAEAEADVILWDGGNNDAPFYAPDLWICVTDAHRAGHGLSHHPGETNLRAADLVIINKVDSALPHEVEACRESIEIANPEAEVLEAGSPITLEGGPDLAGVRVLVVEDGPTVTHGGMGFGAGLLAAEGADAEIVDPRPHLKGTLAGVFEHYGHLERVLPAMGYGAAQVADLEATIRASGAEAVVTGTPIDIRRVLDPGVPVWRARYDLEEEAVDLLAGWVLASLDEIEREGE